MVRHIRWTAALLAAALTAACGVGRDGEEASQVVSGAPPLPATAVPQITSTPVPATLDYTRLEKYIPTDNELPDRVAYATKLDLGNEKAASDAAQLKQFQDTGRVTGIQFILSVEAGTRTISAGISYYNNTAEPKKLLRHSGDPAAADAPNRFQMPPVGDEFIAQRVQLGSGEAAAYVVNIAWVRGRFFIALADLGGAEDTPTDVAVAIARLVDDKIKADPAP